MKEHVEMTCANGHITKEPNIASPYWPEEAPCKECGARIVEAMVKYV